MKRRTAQDLNAEDAQKLYVFSGLFGSLYAGVKDYADYVEIGQAFLEKQNGRITGPLSRQFQERGISKISYAHFHDVLELIDDWLETGEIDQKRCDKIKKIADSQTAIAAELVHELEEEEGVGFPQMLAVQGHALQILEWMEFFHSIEEVNSPESRQSYKKSIERATTNIKPRDFNQGDEFGSDYFKGGQA